MEKLTLLVLFVVSANCASIPVDDDEHVVRTGNYGGLRPPHTGGHGQGSGQSGFVHHHQQQNHGHQHGQRPVNGHQHGQRPVNGHQHGQRPVNGHRPVQGQRPPIGSTQPIVPVGGIGQGPFPVRPDHLPYGQGQRLNEYSTSPPIAIIQQQMETNPDGSFHNVWESANGIKVQEEGAVRVIDRKTVAHTVTGQVSYTDVDGNPILLRYVADEFGFHPVGDHLPTPPPIPLGIARGLEWIAAHPPPKETDETGVYVENH